MGGLRSPMPTTFWTFLIGSLALAGIPPLAGFWSKDELITLAWHERPVLFVTLLVTAVITAFYMTRAVALTFFGDYRGHGHPHEAPLSMTGPLVALAAVTVVAGFVGAPLLGAPFNEWVFFEEPHVGEFFYGIAAVSVAAAVAGIALGWRLYGRRRERDPMLELGPVTTVLENRYYMDDFYMNRIVLPIRDRVSSAVYWSNQRILDGAVNGAGGVARGLSRVVAWFDRRVIDGAVNGAANTAGFTGGLLRYIQSGNVQRYAAFLFTGIVILAVVFTRF
jgi:NADH-quinone oxidoreductase subunit L